MKLFDNIPPTQEEIKIVNQRQIEKQTQVDSVIPFRGHTMFEIDCTTGEISKANYEVINSAFIGGSVRKKIIIKPNCLYISCLNLKSARKKYFKWIVERTIQNHKATKGEL